jgi:quinol monooxygenase YgiN
MHGRLREENDGMSVLEVVRFRCQDGKGDEFGPALANDLAGQVADPECLALEILRSAEDPNDFLAHIEWTTIEAHEAWRAANRNRERPFIAHLLAGAELLGHYSSVAHPKAR